MPEVGSGDAPEIKQLVFQQSKSYIYLEVPQFQFIDRVLDISVGSTGAVLLEVVETPADVSTTGASRQVCARLA